MIALRRWLMATLLALPGLVSAADYQYCSTCHGATGHGNAAIQAPSLAGIEAWYLAAQLTAYRERHRGRDGLVDPAGAEMRTVAREIGAEQITDITRHIASFRVAPLPRLVEGDTADGRQLYGKHCAACHGAKAEGNEALQAPALSRLNDWYVVSSYRKYRSGARGADGSPAAAVSMHAATAALPADLRIENIARFLNSQQPKAARSTP